MSGLLSGKTGFVTGAANGIGKVSVQFSRIEERTRALSRSTSQSRLPRQNPCRRDW